MPFVLVLLQGEPLANQGARFLSIGPQILNLQRQTNIAFLGILLRDHTEAKRFKLSGRAQLFDCNRFPLVVWSPEEAGDPAHGHGAEGLSIKVDHIMAQYNSKELLYYLFQVLPQRCTRW